MYTQYIGIDEVGRGALAGPMLVVAARNKSRLPSGLKDSKMLTRRQRQKLNSAIIKCCEIGQGWISSVEIDELGLSNCLRLGVARALSELKAKADEPIIMDGPINYCHDRFVDVRSIIKADQKYQVVSAASIVAKVLRDEYMIRLSEKFPAYGFERHVGYGTRSHIDTLIKIGGCRAHRASFEPLKSQPRVV